MARAQWIAETGHHGRDRTELAEGLRSMAYRERLIVYRIDDVEVRILRFLHGRRDIGCDDFVASDT
jgi:toxin ParE1/3/4